MNGGETSGVDLARQALLAAREAAKARRTEAQERPRRRTTSACVGIARRCERTAHGCPRRLRVLEALERHIHSLDRDAVVFTTLTKSRAGRLLDDGNWRRQTWWPAVERAHYFDGDGEQQFVPHYPPHSMRHTCASWLVQKGVPLYKVQHLLGHESFQTTQRYAHLQPDAHNAVLGTWERLDVPLTIAA
ncbi:tyrosine-type recombinase/integrase [Streptomyces sp. NPDC012438]|uniref:tyrosine-type recombinase/integrase n=1 Tax=Streptomyces sp. NPDC012438 TaxID=3364833 RepID=UPI0036EEA1CE